MNTDLKAYRRSCRLGALGAALMLVGDLCLSVIPASSDDRGLFLREAYLNGSFQTWRLPFLLATGLLGMAFCFFAVRAVFIQVQPQYRKTRQVIRAGGLVYLTSAATLHFFVGSLADWTSVLSPVLGRAETAELIQMQYDRIAPAMLIAYAGMIVLALASAWAVLTKRTFLPRRMFIFHMLVWQLILMLVPDIRQALGAEPSTADFILSQSSGNAGLFIWMTANSIWAKRRKDTP